MYWQSIKHNEVYLFCYPPEVCVHVLLFWVYNKISYIVATEKWAITMTNTSHLSNTMLSEIVVPCVLVVLLLVVALTIYVLRHKRLQRSFLSYANSHYDTRSGTAHFSSSDDLGESMALHIYNIGVGWSLCKMCTVITWYMGARRVGWGEF